MKNYKSLDTDELEEMMNVLAECDCHKMREAVCCLSSHALAIRSNTWASAAKTSGAAPAQAGAVTGGFVCCKLWKFRCKICFAGLSVLVVMVFESTHLWRVVIRRGSTRLKPFFRLKLQNVSTSYAHT